MSYDEIIKIFSIVYDLSPVPLRLSYAFWIGLMTIYSYAHTHDKYNSKPKPREFDEVNFSKALPFLGIGNVLLYWWANYKKFPFSIHMFSDDIAIPIGLVLMTIGFYVTCRGRAAINGYWGPHLYRYTNPEDRKIIRHGIYKNIRHPIYSGQVYMAYGTLFLSNNTVFIIFAVLLTIINVIRAKREERYLKEQYGNEFEDYKKKTYRAIPSIF